MQPCRDRLALREEVLWWVELAQRNLKRAEDAMGVPDYAEAVFWCHQAVEFALKAYVLWKGELPVKTHNLLKLVRQAGLEDAFPRHELAELSPYYSISRYPDVFEGVPEVEEETARRFYDLASTVVEEIKEMVGLGGRGAGRS